MTDNFTLTKKQYNAFVVAGDNCLGWDQAILEKDRDGYIEVTFFRDLKHIEEVKRIKL